jgi:uncharacterized membrane protein HdeD (DUF308 family)
MKDKQKDKNSFVYFIVAVGLVAILSGIVGLVILSFYKSIEDGFWATIVAGVIVLVIAAMGYER